MKPYCKKDIWLSRSSDGLPSMQTFVIEAIGMFTQLIQDHEATSGSFTLIPAGVIAMSGISHDSPFHGDIP